MTLTKTLSLLALAAVIAAPCSAGYFSRPTISIVSSNNDAFDGKFGYGLTIGKALDARGRHEISFDFSTSKWDIEPLGGGGFGELGLRGNGSREVYLLGYRYQTGSNETPVRFYFGPYAGVANVRGHYEWHFSGRPPFGGHNSDLNPALGGTVGINWKLGTNISLDIGARVLWVDGVDAYFPTLIGTGPGGRIILPDVTTTGLYAGLRFAF